MIKTRILCAAALCAILAGVTTASADDLYPPDWRHDPGSTYQAWEFSTNANPAIPDELLNPYGDPTAAIAGSFPYTRWKSEDMGHQGVWTFEDYMLLTIPNNPVPNELKLIQIQITFYADAGSTPEILTLPEFGELDEIHKIQIDDYYWHGTYLLSIEPNPDSEQIYILPRDCTLYVDELVVDTICIPEPATALLLLVPGIALLRRR